MNKHISRPSSRLVGALLRFSILPAQRILLGIVGAIALVSIVSLSVGAIQPNQEPTLWQVYQHSLKPAKYVDLTHTIPPTIPVWAGFGASTFLPSVNPKTGKAYTYKQDNFEATHYNWGYQPCH